MADKQIQSDSPVWGYAGNAEQKIIETYNNSGITLFTGDVVIIDLTTLNAAPATGASGGMKTTTVASDPLTAGVVSLTGDATTNGQGIPPGGSMYVCYFGVARVNIGANTVAASAAISSSATARVAAAVAAAVGGSLGVALEANTAKDANNTIRCFIKLA